jgi:outer membrane lipoprotein
MAKINFAHYLTRSVYLIAVILATGCASPFPKDLMEKVDARVGFRELQSNPDKHMGATVMLAGVIADVKNAQEGTYLEVVQKPHERRGRPEQTDSTEGRFIVYFQDYLDKAVYRSGRDITVIGEARGIRVQPLGEVEYRYPYLVGTRLHLWERSSGPAFSFGLGIGVSRHR